MTAFKLDNFATSHYAKEHQPKGTKPRKNIEANSKVTLEKINKVLVKTAPKEDTPENFEFNGPFTD